MADPRVNPPGRVGGKFFPTTRRSAADFTRPDGTFDTDAFLTADLDPADYRKIMEERGFKKNVGSSGYGSVGRVKPVERFGLQPGAKMTDVRGLGGDEVAPVPKDAAEEALEQLSGKAVKPRLLGAHVPEDRYPEPRLLGEFDADTPENRLSPDRPTRPNSGKWNDPINLAKPNDPNAREIDTTDPNLPTFRVATSQPLPPRRPGTGAIVEQEQLAQPFPDRSEPVNLPVTVEEGVPENRWTPSSISPRFEEAQQNKSLIDPGGASPAAPQEAKAGWLARLFSSEEKPTEADPVDDLARLRKEAGGAVGAMKADEQEHVQDADFGRVEAKVRDMSKPKAALEKFQASRGPSGPLGGPGPSDSGAARPQFDKTPVAMLAELEGKTPGPASARNPLQAAQQLGMGAAPDTSKDEADMDAASKARDNELLLAQIASNFGHYSDVLGGTQGPDRGASIRANAQRTLEDLKAKRGLRQSAADRQTELADKQYERAGIDQQRGALGAKTQREADFNDAGSKKSKQARAIAVSLYPKLVARIPPQEFAGMSAADVEMFLKEAAPEKVAGAGKGGFGGGIKPGEMNSLRKQLPPQLVDTYDQLQNAYAEIEGMGGWSQVKSGLIGSMTPTMFMDPSNQKVRQTIGRVVSAFLQSGGGKAITSNEEKILIGKIGADPTSFGVTPEMLERGMSIVERAMSNAARQATAGAPQGAKDALFGDMGIDQEWVKGGKIPSKPGQVKPMGGKRKLRNPKTGQEIEIDD